MIRAVLEGVALNTRWILDPVERLAGRRADPIRIGGGGATSRVWAQIIADVLDRRVQVVEDPAFATARGAALLAAVGVGATTFEQIASSLRVVREHAPDPLRSRRYEAAYANYRAFHASTRRLFRRMNRLARVRV